MLRAAVLVLLLTGMLQARTKRPLAHLTGNLPESRSYPANTEITDFRVDEPFRRFTFEDGRLTAGRNGSYYIYAQVFFETYPDGPSVHNQVALSVNGEPISVLQPGLGPGWLNDYGSVSTGRVVTLLKGDNVSLVTVEDSRLWVTDQHTFLGAYKITTIPPPNE